MIFYDKEKRAVLLYLRDDKPGIPFPGMLDILGGTVEGSETPEQAIVREISEELYDLRSQAPFALKDFKLFTEFSDKAGVRQSVFSQEADFDINDIKLREGRKLVWLSEEDLACNDIAFGLKPVLKEFMSVMLNK